MKPHVKVALFLASLTIAFAAAFGAARAIAPDGLADRGGHAMAMHGSDMAPVLRGLEAASDGFRLVSESSTLSAGVHVPFRFRITDGSGRAVTSYRLLHERELHLIVVRRDLTGFQHVHPTRGEDGTWTAYLNLPAGGTWRAFTDVAPAGGPEQVTLGTDLQVAGEYAPGSLPKAVAATTDDVTLDRSGERITVSVSRAGAPITPEPYLGARGHLVAIRSGDLGYAHVHPEVSPGPAVRFTAELPPGTYGLFFDYQSSGVVTTATSTVEVH
jgi:hypothetical protein